MPNKTYKILYLCHDLLDFDGSRGDMIYFLARLEAYGIPHTCHWHQTNETIDVSDFDFVYLGIAPQKYEPLLLVQFNKYIKGLKSYIESGKPLLAVEQGFLMLGNNLVRGEEVRKLSGILPFNVFQQEGYTTGNILLASAAEHKNNFDNINGFFNSRYAFELPKEEAYQPLGKILLGKDYLWERGYEGMIYKGLYGTQLRGPVLPRNYDLCDTLIRLMLGGAILPKIDSVLEERAKNQLTEDCQRFIDSGEQKKEYVYVS